MDVIDFLKKKKEMLTVSQAEMRERLSPALFDHWAEVSHNMSQRITQKRQDISEQWQQFIKEPLISNGSFRPTLAYSEPSPADALKAELARDIGKETFVGEWFEVTQDRINEFARVTQDQQWIHTDPVRSKAESPFKGTIAHGFLTMSLIPYLTNTVDEANSAYPTSKMSVNYGMDNVRFQFPVKEGVKIRARSKLLKVSNINQGLEVTREIKIEIENVRRPAVVLESLVRVYF